MVRLTKASAYLPHMIAMLERSQPGVLLAGAMALSFCVELQSMGPTMTQYFPAQTRRTRSRSASPSQVICQRGIR